jgi:NADP-dependent 3-hydroxy acid dehydrogenase YdfG
MARMRTLGEIVQYFSESLPAPSAEPVANGGNGAHVPPVAASAPTDLVGLMLSIVAEKTGYPVEMIELTQDLESDLGIDSIKRVEILAAVRDREPNLPSVDPGRMARMRTLGEIVKYFRGSQGEESPGSIKAGTTGRVEPASNDVPAATTDAPVGRFRVRATPCTASGLTLPSLLNERVCITPDGAGVADALAARLKTFGVLAEVVPRVPDDAGAVIFLGGLRAIGSPDDAVAVQYEAFCAARAVATRFTEGGGAFVTVQDTGGDFGLAGGNGDQAWLGGLVALARSAAAEWPKASVLALDVERGSRNDEAIADAIAGEILAGGLEGEIGLPANGTRLCIESVEAEAGPANRPVEPGAVFVVSGGGRGVTAHALVELARAARPRFVLLGRSELGEEPDIFHGIEDEAGLKRAALDEARAQGARKAPLEIARRVDQIRATREVRDTIARLTREGSEVRYAAVDTRDGQAVARVLDEVRAAWGPVRGLVHGAGVLADALIEKKTDDQFGRVFATKVQGLRALLAATASDPLGWICLFSSVAARTGNRGQSDYAMANETLNHVAAVEARRRGPGCRVVSIGWGPWAGGMVTPSLQGHFEARGIRLLPVREGAAAFVREIQSSGDVNVIVGSDVRPGGRERNHRLKADIMVDGRTWPQLGDHRIQGKPVLPMVVAVEWFARLARSLVRHEQVCLRDLQVVRGVLLTRYDEGTRDHFHLLAEPQDAGAFRLELRDTAGGLHYTARVDPGAQDVPPMSADLELQPSPWKHSELYGLEALFHGPLFQVIRRVDGISERGARATLVGTGDSGWPGGPWCADPAALDGGLQLAFLFGLRNGGRQLLPMRASRVLYSPSPATGPIRCQLVAHDHTPERLVCDLSLEREGGAPLAKLEGVEMFTVPTGTSPR